MKHLVQITAVTIVLSLAAATGAIGVPSPPAAPPGDPQTSDAKDWSQTHLCPEPALREQIERTKAFLDSNAAGMDGEISQLKTEGLIDRRSTSKIRNALSHARGSMTRMAKGIEEGTRIDGWTARMIAFELGMAADTLAQEADPIETALNTGAERGEEAPNDDSSDVDQRQHLARRLRESSRLLNGTARAIVRNLK